MKLSAPKIICREKTSGWCPGCGHGIVIRLLAEALEELGMTEDTVMVKDVACGSMFDRWTDFNNLVTAHGRPMVTAAGVKRARPDQIVISHSGDGSAYSIGIESTIHCALRNENILAIVVNNNVFGMTGGQMSPATLPGQKSTSSPKGRDIEKNGYPLNVEKTIGQYDIAYLARGSVATPKDIIKTGKYLKKALEKQRNGEGFCLVEILSPCPTNWGMTPVDSVKFIQERVEQQYPLGEFVDKGGDK